MRFLMSALVLVFMSCGTKNGQEDSTETAEDQNDEKFEDSKTDDDADFAVKAADGGMLEVQLGTLALTKASSPEVKQFAQMMVDDHSKANNELKAIAQQKNISLPTVLGDDHQKKFDNLNEKSGADFDKDYMDLMVKDHKDDIKEFEDEGDDGKDAELKSWAAGKVATLKHHLEMAERTHDAVKDKKNQ
jgi:putative membrane protein